MKNVAVAENRYNVPTIMLLFAEHGKALTNDLAEKMLLLVHVNKRKVWLCEAAQQNKEFL